MGDQAQGRTTGTRDRSGFGKVSESAASNYSTNRARARAGAFSVGSPKEDYPTEMARQGKITNKRKNISETVMKSRATTPNTGNDMGAKKQPNSRPIAAEKWTKGDAGHKNPQK